MGLVERNRRAGLRGCGLGWVLAALMAAPFLTSCELSYLRSKVENQDQMIDELESSLREWKDAYDKLLQQKVKDNEEFQKQAKNWEMEKRRLTTMRSDRERTLEGSESELKLRLQQEIDKGMKVRKELDAAQSRIALGEKDVSTLKTTQGQLEKDLAAARNEATTFRGQVQAAEKSRQTAEQRAKTAENELKPLKATLQERDQKIKELAQTATDLQNDIKMASDNKTTMSVLVTSLRKQLAEEKRVADDERQRHKTEMARLTKELASARGPSKGQDAALSKAKDELAEVLAAEIKDKSAEVIGSFDRVTVRLRSDVLFQPQTLLFRDSAQTRLRQIADVLAKYPGYQLRVEGHTDDQPVRDMPLPDNLALSSLRASNVLRFLTEATKLSQKQIRATGCSDSQPIASNDTADGRQRNRRVEIILSQEE